MNHMSWIYKFIRGLSQMTSAYFWSFLTPPPPYVSVCQTLNTPLSNDVRPEHTPLLRTIFTKFISKKVTASRNLPNAHFGTIKNHVGQNCTIGRQIQKLGILVFAFVAIAAKCPFLLTSSLVKPPSPMSGFVSISLTPLPPLGCWRHLWKHTKAKFG